LPLGVSARPGNPRLFRFQRGGRLIQVLNFGTDFRLPLRQDFGEDDTVPSTESWQFFARKSVQEITSLGHK
jgi:hypothetical protein